MSENSLLPENQTPLCGSLNVFPPVLLMVEAEQLSTTFYKVTFQVLEGFSPPEETVQGWPLVRNSIFGHFNLLWGFLPNLAHTLHVLNSYGTQPGPGFLLCWLQGRKGSMGPLSWWCVSRLCTGPVISTVTNSDKIVGTERDAFRMWPPHPLHRDPKAGDTC